MEQLKKSKQVAKTQGESPTKRTGLTGTIAGTMNVPFAEGSAVDILLFGQRKSSNFTKSLTNSVGSDLNPASAHVVQGLKNLIRVSNITKFAISTVNADGSRIYTVENVKAAGGNGKVSVEVQLSTKIQVLLDQRKPPTEVLPSLCSDYDDNLNLI
jgi:hypothetical protein